MRASLKFMGLMGADTPTWATGENIDLTLYERKLSDAREVAMQSKDFSEVDRLKAAFVAAGVEVRMSKTGVELVPGPSFDSSKLDAI